jgi:hypothetical protein
MVTGSYGEVWLARNVSGRWGCDEQAMNPKPAVDCSPTRPSIYSIKTRKIGPTLASSGDREPLQFPAKVKGERRVLEFAAKNAMIVAVFRKV